MSDKPHGVHWLSGTATKVALADHEEAERFTHIAYGELVKHFGLGSAVTFAPWNDLPEDVRAKWIGALTEVRQDLAEAEENPASKKHS